MGLGKPAEEAPAAALAVGRQLGALAALNGKRTTMELGGHAPVIVCDDADIDALMPIAVERKFTNAGQICVSPTRVYVHGHVFDRFVEGFVARTRAIRLGHGLESGTRMGPLAHARRPSAVQALVDDAAGVGARVLSGGRRGEAGCFFEPTVLADLPETCLTFSDLLDYEFVGLAPESRMTSFLTGVAARMGRTMVYRMHVASFEVVGRIIAEGLAIGFVPADAMKPHATRLARWWNHGPNARL